jgi:hypothetical protein
VDAIDQLLYMPASFVCDKCNFHLEKATLFAASGEIGIPVEGYEPEPCPNDGELLRHVTWKEAYENTIKHSNEMMLALIESVKLQSHYAAQLNAYDEGRRREFSCPAEWIQRLIDTGVIEPR